MSISDIHELFTAWKEHRFESDWSGYLGTLTDAELDMVRSWQLVYDYGFNTGYSCAVEDGYKSV